MYKRHTPAYPIKCGNCKKGYLKKKVASRDRTCYPYQLKDIKIPKVACSFCEEGWTMSFFLDSNA